MFVLLYGAVRRHRHIVRSVRFAWRFGFDPVDGARHARDRFQSRADFAAFLGAHFSCPRHIVSDFGLNGLGDAVVHRLLPGGSDALTALVESGDRLTIRKFATGGAAVRLKIQADWLRAYRQHLPLAEVTAEFGDAESYRYDMPYILSARDFYEVIHTTPVETSARVVSEIVAAIARLHGEAAAIAPPATIDAYLEQKAMANVREILAYAELLLDSPDYTINDQSYRLAEWDVLLDPTWLRSQISHPATGLIHGDLTIENIIICPERAEGWYIIDPNPDNIFQSPLIDWAKLMQSLNLGYEGLNRTNASTIQGTAIKLFLTKSAAYDRLHAHLETLLEERFGGGIMQEIAFHELVNYLRLTPYKIRQGQQKAVTFFACASLLLRRYRERVAA